MLKYKRRNDAPFCIRALWGTINNTPEHHPEGTYYLRYTIANGRRAWEPVGQNPNHAIAAQPP